MDASERSGLADLPRAVVLPDPAPSHPLLEGKAEIGRGEYSIVFDKGDCERVYKVVSSPADYFLLTAEDRPRGRHFPIVHVDHGVIGRAQSGYPFHLLEMEKLYPLAPQSSSAALALRLAALYRETCRQCSHRGADTGRIALHQIATTAGAGGFEGSMREALRALDDFVEGYRVLPDLAHVDNLMVRKDGTLVFADPVFIA